jgi:hypothetical protein
MASNFLCLGGLCVVIGLGLLYAGIQKYLLVQKITDTPTSKVRSAAVGMVELSGKAVCKEPQFSPLSNVKCIYWKMNAEWFQPGRNGGWRMISSDSSHKDFDIEDDTGKMLVDPTGATIEIPVDFSSMGYLRDRGFLGIVSQRQLDPKVLAYLESNPDAKARVYRFSGYELKFTEWYIAEGDPLFVLGTADLQEGVSSSVGSENLIVRQGKYDKVFYISDTGERKVVDTIRNSMYWYIGIGFVLAAAGAYALIA